MKRRDALRELMKPAASEVEDAPVAAAPMPNTKRAEPIRPGALRTMGLSLKQMSAEADNAQALRAQIEGGHQVVDLDPSVVDPSFVADRIPVERDPGFESFVRSIGEAGQQVPILVRPHPTTPGRFQAAYGHRRLKAASVLGRAVRAIVRPLTDVELVVAQGKENGERRDLSFIERASFAAHLEARGFERLTIMSALGVDKADLSRLIALAKAVPAKVVHAIGPAPKTGRPRWTQFVALFEGREDAARLLEEEIASDRFTTADSDRRFTLALDALRTHQAPCPPDAWRDGKGRAVVRIERSSTAMRLIVDERLDPGFGDYLVERLGELHGAFARDRSERTDTSLNPATSTAPRARRKRASVSHDVTREESSRE